MSPLLFHVSTKEGGAILLPLARACARAGYRFDAFFTHHGVEALTDDALARAMAGARRAVVCEESWHRFLGEHPCPVEFGSQTINSELMGAAGKVVSL